MANMAARAIQKGNRTCILVHREEIFKALFLDLKSVGIVPSLIVPGRQAHPGSACYLGMIQTMRRRMAKDLINHLGIQFFMCDEVHDGNYSSVVQELNCHVLGVTATPKSSDAQPDLNKTFEDIVIGPSIRELISLNRLVPAITYSYSHDWSKVKKKKNNKEYDDRALLEEFRKPVLQDGAVNQYHKYCPGVPAICYNLDIEHNLETGNQFRDLGYRVACVDSEDKEARRAGFEAYEDGRVDVLCNVGIATTGYDAPFTRCIIKNFATMSLVKDQQTGGRGGRAWYDAPEDNPKDKFYMIDMGRNYFRHGKWIDPEDRGDEINWEEIFNNPSKAIKDKTEKRTQRECDECGAVIPIRLKKCPYCGDFISEEAIEQIVLQGATAEEIKSYRLSTLPVNLRKETKHMSYHELVDYARHMGHKPAWVHVQMKFRKR